MMDSNLFIIEKLVELTRCGKDFFVFHKYRKGIWQSEQGEIIWEYEVFVFDSKFDWDHMWREWSNVYVWKFRSKMFQNNVRCATRMLVLTTYIEYLCYKTDKVANMD